MFQYLVLHIVVVTDVSETDEVMRTPYGVSLRYFRSRAPHEPLPRVQRCIREIQ